MDAEKIAEGIIDDLMEGETLKVRRSRFPLNVSLADLIAEEGPQYMLTPEQCATLAHGDICDLLDLQMEFKKSCRKLCDTWLDSANGQDYLRELVCGMEEDQRAEAAEARAELRRELKEPA